MISAMISTLLVTALAQTRGFDQIMKDVATTFADVEEGLDAEAFSDVGADARRLERLFDEVEEFWAAFNTRDAIDFAETAQRASSDIVVASEDAQNENARAAYARLEESCTGCHNAHREVMPDGSFRIKP